MNACAGEVCSLLSLLVRAMVTDRNAVAVTAYQRVGTTIFQVSVGNKDRGKLIGQQGRTARSLRLIVACIAKENGANFFLQLD